MYTLKTQNLASNRLSMAVGLKPGLLCLLMINLYHNKSEIRL